jgi:poly-beta-1,6 N-acetyl-D-glucosamine synthase
MVEMKNIIYVTVLFIFITFGFLLYFLSSILAFFSLLGAATMVAYLYVMALLKRRGKFLKKVPSFIPFILLFSPFIFAVYIYYKGVVWFELFIQLLFITSLTMTFFYNFFSVPLAVYNKYLEQKSRNAELETYPFVSILIPAYNEEKCIAETIENALEVDYPNKEVIVINDGSTDRTFEIASRYVPRINLLTKPNGGKSSALNYGLLFGKGEIIVTIDADGRVGRNCVREIVKRFQDENVKAVCGNIKVLNRVNLLTKCQALEYISSINIFRRAFDVFGCVTVIPGALGAIRREVLEEGGVYDKDTMAEDFDVTLKILKTGEIVQASSDALCFTQAPETLRDFYNQRIRWYRGNAQTLLKHKDAILNPRYGFLHELAMPFILVSMFFVPFASFIVLASAIGMVMTGGGMEVLKIFTTFVILQFLLSFLSLQLDDEDSKLSFYSPLFVVGYKQLTDLIVIKGLMDVLTGRKKLEWTRARRLRGI